MKPIKNKVMKTKAFFLIVLAVIVSANVVNAQDTIVKKTNEVIPCKITEVGLDEIKYTRPDLNHDVIYVVDKVVVSHVVFEDGENIKMVDNFNNPENYLNDNKNALKVEFLSPLTGNTTIAWEHSLKPGRSYEIALGLIGLGMDKNENNPAGIFLKGGYKFIKTPDFYIRGMRYTHILKGGYVKPELAFGFYSKEFTTGHYWEGTEIIRRSVVTGAIFLNFGKQWIYDNSFLVDMYFGLGYGFDSYPCDGGYHYGFTVGSGHFPIAVQGGLKIGFLFK
jgi:hypothetical protein